MNNPCEICITEDCKGERTCNCETCKSRNNCPKLAGLMPTLRITTKCTQKCLHCCFSCSPQRNEMMSVETAKKVASFYRSNGIEYTQIMGGECFLNENWENIFREIIPTVSRVRIVTNGDWSKECPEFIQVISEFPQVHISISNDKWHSNNNINLAAELCKNHKVSYNICGAEDMPENGIVPIGRGEYFSGSYAFFSSYCRNPIHHYSFLIDENGIIYKCGFGVWDYANVEDYVDGGFNVRFKEFGIVFMKCFFGSCSTCSMGYSFNGKKGKRVKSND